MFSSYFFVLAIVALLSIALGSSKYECPSSPDKSHAGCQVYTVFENQCSVVQQEMMKVRVDGDGDGDGDGDESCIYTMVVQHFRVRNNVAVEVLLSYA